MRLLRSSSDEAEGRARETKEFALAGSADGYVRVTYQSLAVFRFVSFAMGAGLTYGLNPGVQPSPVLISILVVSGANHLVWAGRRIDLPKHSPPAQWFLVGLDACVAVALVLVSSGLDSPFLLSSLAPILMASLLTAVRTSLAIATATALSITGAHLAAGLGFGGYPWVLTGNYLAFCLLFSAVCLLMAYLPFVANLNWHRRLRAESLGAERQRLRREVHDNVAQTLAFLALKMRRAEERASEPSKALVARDVQDIGRAVGQAYLAVRDYLDGDEDPVDDTPLGDRLAGAIGRWRRETGLTAQFRTSGDEGDLPPKVKFQLLQIAREALANVAKHASAEDARVELDCDDCKVTLTVSDDGRGFGTSALDGHGLEIMRQRASLIEGSLTVNSAPGQGTEVVVGYPRKAQEQR